MNPFRKYLSFDARLASVQRNAERSAEIVADAVKTYAQANAEKGEALQRVATREKFTIVQDTARRMSWLALAVAVIYAVVLIMAVLGDDVLEAAGVLLNVGAGGAAVLIFVSALLFAFARSDQRSHKEFIKYSLGQSISDELLKVSDVRQAVEEALRVLTPADPEKEQKDKKKGDAARAAEAEKMKKTRLQVFMNNVALNFKNADLFGLRSIEIMRKRLERNGPVLLGVALASMAAIVGISIYVSSRLLGRVGETAAVQAAEELARASVLSAEAARAEATEASARAEALAAAAEEADRKAAEAKAAKAAADAAAKAAEEQRIQDELAKRQQQQQTAVSAGSGRRAGSAEKNAEAAEAADARAVRAKEVADRAAKEAALAEARAAVAERHAEQVRATAAATRAAAEARSAAETAAKEAAKALKEARTAEKRAAATRAAEALAEAAQKEQAARDATNTAAARKVEAEVAAQAVVAARSAIGETVQSGVRQGERTWLVVLVALAGVVIMLMLLLDRWFYRRYYVTFPRAYVKTEKAWVAAAKDAANNPDKYGMPAGALPEVSPADLLAAQTVQDATLAASMPAPGFTTPQSTYYSPSMQPGYSLYPQIPYPPYPQQSLYSPMQPGYYPPR